MKCVCSRRLHLCVHVQPTSSVSNHYIPLTHTVPAQWLRSPLRLSQRSAPKSQTHTQTHICTCTHTPDTQDLLSLSFKVGTKACSRWLRQRQHADSLSHTPHALSFTHTHTSYMYTPSLHCQAPYEHLNRLKGFVCHVILQPCDLTAEPAHQGHMQGAKM